MNIGDNEYFLNKTADSRYGNESLIKLVHECSDGEADHRFYHIMVTRPISWEDGRHKVDRVEFLEVDIYVLQNDLRHPSEDDYLYNVKFCPFCGLRFGALNIKRKEHCYT